MDALKLIKERPWNFVVTDIHLPHLDGDHIIRKIVEAKRGIRVYGITGDDDKVIIRNAYFDGACGFIKKPLTSDEVKEAFGPCLQALDRWARILE